MRQSTLSSLLLAGTLLLSAGSASAHGFWIEQRRGHFEGVFGHESAVEAYPSKALVASWGYDLQGQPIKIDIQRMDDHARLVPRKPPAVLAAALNSAFFSAVEGNNESWKYAITVLEPGAKFNVGKDIRLVLLPEVDPLTVGTGKPLPLRVLVDGKPVEGVTLMQDYRGIGTRADEKDVKTDKDGRAKVIVRNNGWNVIAGFHAVDDGGKKVSLHTTLAFQGVPYEHN